MITGAKETIYVYDYANNTYLPKSLWYGERHDASTKGTNLLKEMIPGNPFDFPKSVYSVEDFLEIGSSCGDTVLDFFAGSGTTGHACINLFRNYGEARKCLLVDNRTHFDNVTLRRLRKAAFSNSWKKGKPTNYNSGVPVAIKYIRLESYEDTLNNIEPRRKDIQSDLLGNQVAQGDRRSA